LTPAIGNGLACTPGSPEAEKNDEATQDIANATIGFEKKALHLFPNQHRRHEKQTILFSVSLDRFPASFIVCF